MIKPDGVRANHTDAIKEIIAVEGFRIVTEKEAVFDAAAAQSFYQEHSERSFFPQLVEFMTRSVSFASLPSSIDQLRSSELSRTSCVSWTLFCSQSG